MSSITQFASAVAPQAIMVNSTRTTTQAASRTVASTIRAAFAYFVVPAYGEQRYKDSDFFATSKWDGYGRNGVTWDGIGWRI